MSDTCGCGCGHDHDDHVHEEMEMETLTLTLDDDTEMECGILGVFAVDGIADKEYIALLPLEDETCMNIRKTRTASSFSISKAMTILKRYPIHSMICSMTKTNNRNAREQG
mgnify:FL=1